MDRCSTKPVLAVVAIVALIAAMGCGGPNKSLERSPDGITYQGTSTPVARGPAYPHVEGYTTIAETDVQLWYQRTGPRDGPAVILITGSDFASTMWHDELVGALLAAGFDVIRYDQRDCGRSEWLPWPKGFKAKKWTPAQPPPYPLIALRDDLLGLMSALDIRSAHLVGVSMGGMVAQLLAVHEPGMVRSLTLMSTSPSSSFDSALTNPTEDELRANGKRIKKAAIKYYMSRSDAWIDRMVVAMQAITGASDEGEDLRAYLQETEAFGGYNFMSSQGFAIVSAPSRVEDLPSIVAPTLVLHGTADPWFDYSHAELLAERIPNATLIPIEGQGHGLPRDMYNAHLEHIVGHLQAASAEP